MTPWDERLPEALARNLAARGFEQLTPVQQAVLAAGPGAGDLLVSASTGSGKTVAFGLALASLVLAPERGGAVPRALVVTPTRELARQVADELAWLYAGTGVRVGCCVGGADPRPERAELARGLEVVVGSPGRLRGHVALGALMPGGVAAVVLDEADDMLDLGFRDDLEAVLDALPRSRRLIMFSATVTRRVEALAARYQTGAARIDAADPGAGPAATGIVSGDREQVVVRLLRLYEAPAALIFCGRREAAGQLAARLAARGFRAVAFSAALSLGDRGAALAAVREGRARVCVATDLAARGLVFPGLDLVIHADLPADPAVLVHRSGRTGRSGRRGQVVLIVPPGQRRRAEKLAARARLALEWVPVPSVASVRARDLERMLADPALGEPADAVEREIAAGLIAAHPPVRIATAFGRLWRAGRPDPEAAGEPEKGG